MLALVTAAAVSLSGCFGGGSPSNEKASAERMPDAALKVMAQPQYEHGRWVISVSDLDTGEVLLDQDGDKMAEPGSVVKTYAMGAA